MRAGRLLDGTGAPPIDDGAVLIEGDRIVAVGPAAAVPAPDGAERLEFPELTLLPGLVDCHSHVNLPGDGTGIEDAALADLLLVAGDPTVDVTALNRVGAVFLGGQRVR